MGRLLVKNASSQTVAVETVIGIPSPASNNGKKRVYLHDIRIMPTAADFAADVDIWINDEYTDTELVTNGTFATDTAWTKGTGWVIGATGVATKTPADVTTLTQAILPVPVIGDFYQLSYDIVKTANGITPGYAGDTAPADQVTGTWNPVLVAASTANVLTFTADAAANVVVDNVSLKKFGSNVNPWMHDSIRSGAVEPYHRVFDTKQPYSTNGWSIVATSGGAATILDMVVTYEVV